MRYGGCCICILALVLLSFDVFLLVGTILNRRRLTPRKKLDNVHSGSYALLSPHYSNDKIPSTMYLSTYRLFCKLSGNGTVYLPNCMYSTFHH
jgi:hypothetical protein